jgi:hypothetical protein
MRRPGRKSAASLAVVVPDISQMRPEPPERLTDDERNVWLGITERLRPDWVRGSEFLLEILCHSVVMERFISEQIKRCDPRDEKRLGILVRMQRDQAAVIARLSTKMRLTPRSSFDRTAPKLTSPYPKPWDLGKRSDDEKPPPAA